MEIWIPVVVALITSVISYFASISKSKNELKIAQVKHNSELERLERENKAALDQLQEQHKNEIEKMTLEIEKQAMLYESNSQVDVVKQFMGNKKISGKMEDLLLKEFEKKFKGV